MGIGGFFKGLGKIALKAAPIATAFIPGIGPVLSTMIGAGAGAASGAIDHGLKGALIGGLMGGGTSALGSLAKAGKLGAFGKSSIGKAILGTGANQGGAAGAPSGGLLDRLLSGNVLQSAGQGVGAIGQTQAHNRGVALDAMMQADQNRIFNDQDRRSAESDLMKKMQITNYLKSGGFKDTGPGTSTSGKPFGKFDFGVRPASESEMAMANTLEGQLMHRLNNPPQLRDYDSKMNPSGTETAMNWLGPILTTAGVARGAGQYQQPQATVLPSQLPRKPPAVPEIPVTPGLTTAPGELIDLG